MDAFDNVIASIFRARNGGVRRMTQNIYLVSAGNQPTGVEPTAFGSLAIQERRDVEDWVVKNPSILGEPLLIITPEFDRFDRSNRRLDVLALDQAGSLVVVELKLDIAGSMADQQAIRYAAFCSTMTMKQVVEQFGRYHGVEEAEGEARILEFLQSDQLPELGNKPRIILAAGSMEDAEVTSCVLWLRGFGVDITCVELTPYRLPDRAEILLVPRVIIPLPEARDYVIRVEQKEVIQTQDLKEKRGYSQLWAMVAEEYNQLNAPLRATGNPQTSYFQIRIGSRSIHYEWQILKRRSQIIVALHFESSDAEENYRWLSLIREHMTEIQAGISAPFSADRWGKKWAAVSLAVPYVGAPDRDTAKACAALMKKLIERTEHLVRPLVEANGTPLVQHSR